MEGPMHTPRPAARRRLPRALLAATAVLGAALVVGACGGSTETAPEPGSQSAAKAKRPTGPVEDQLGFDQEGILARQSRVEAAIRDCMKAEGFDYVPIDPIAQRAALLG